MRQPTLSLVALALQLAACGTTDAPPPDASDDVLPSGRDAQGACDVCVDGSNDADAPPKPLGNDASVPRTPDQPACEPVTAGITVARVLPEMIDPLHLTRWPEPAYTSHLASSYNRRADTAAPGEPDWFANQDFIRFRAGEEVTLLDVDGPGVITRMWSASPSGILRLYIDGEDEPAIEASFAGLLSGAEGPFGEPFAFVAAFGHNLYFPIPFAEHVRVTLTGESDALTYYHISYRAYAAGAEVESFGDGALQRAQCMRDHVAAALRALTPATQAPAAEGTEMHELSSERDEDGAILIQAPSGGGVLRQLRIWPSEVSIERFLRATALAIEMDGELTVLAPLSDLFALGFGAREVNSLPVGFGTEGTLTARWPMPFSNEARIWLADDADGALQAALEVSVEAAPFTEQSLYLYARWRAPETFPSEPPRDYLVAHIEGQGFYVGNTLNVINRSAGWWGEGEEKVFVDGEAFPSHFGTGTEDYYGYAWCANEVFTRPYIGQTVVTTHKSFGYSSLYRFHIFDPIPFRDSIRFHMEIGHWGDPVDVTYDSLSVWYSRPGSLTHEVSEALGDYRLPVLDVEPPDGVAPGAYRCGG